MRVFDYWGVFSPKNSLYAVEASEELAELTCQGLTAPGLPFTHRPLIVIDGDFDALSDTLVAALKQKRAR